MITKLFTRSSVALAATAALTLGSSAAQAQVVINDTLTGGHSLYNWKALNGACLTAGDNTVTPHVASNPYSPPADALTIPACIDPTTHANFSYYTGKTLVGGATGTLPDASGSGALRLTNGDPYKDGGNGDQQTGAIISNFTYPASQGLNITWTTVTYGGDNLSGHGADGMSFFLSDGAKNPTVAGGSGGSLGYSCSNKNPVWDGLVGGYLGVGVDEYGNFMNGSTLNSDGTYAAGDNTATGSGFHASTIGVRGAGNVAYAELATNFPTHYTAAASTSSANQQAAVYKTCIAGKVWDMATNSYTSLNVDDYKYLTSVALPGTVTLANQQSTSTRTPSTSLRGSATLISYTINITSVGKMTFGYSVNGGATATPLPNYDLVANNGALPTNVRFGFSAGTGSGSNVHEITCFKAAPSDTSDSSAGSNVQQSARITTGSQVFLAYYHPTNWWGSLQANDLYYDSSTDSILTMPNATWDASCKLTGGACPAMNATTPPTVTAQATRVILSNDGTSNGGSGVAFTSTGLTPAQLGQLQDSTANPQEIDYLRGGRSKEASHTGGIYRNRTSLLGDIVDSSPVWVGYPNSAYTGPWTDKLGGSANASMPEASTYAAWASGKATRKNVLYVGANDGMLHGFSTGSFAAPVGSAPPVFDSTYNTGDELLAYVPAQVISVIHPTLSTTDSALAATQAALDFSNPSYVHNFFVDATPGTGDLYYGSPATWHTWLVGGLGPGGHANGAIQDNTAVIPQPVSALFALDITDPSTFSEANASSLVVGEWNSSSIRCAGGQGGNTCGTNLGQTLGTPLIRRLHDGTWGVIFGNGTNSYGGGTTATAGHSGLFIMHVAADGTKTFQYIDASSGPNGGIVQVAAADLDGDHVTDFVYGGDVLGNLYRFDLTDASAGNWTALKIFQAQSWQPITSTPVVTSIPAAGSGNPKVIVAFGTGQKLPVTTTQSELYAPTTSTHFQAMYGIWDANMTAWNATNTDTKYAAIQTSPATTAVPITQSLLQTQTVSGATTTRTVTNVTMCWAGMSGCASGTTPATVTGAMGWVVNMPTSTEQIIYNPLVANGDIFVNTTIPPTSQLFTCTSTDIGGWTMGLSLGNGGAGVVPAFDGGYSGYSLNGAGTPAIYGYGTSSYLGTNTNDHHQFKSKKLAPQPGIGKRVTWTKVR